MRATVMHGAGDVHIEDVPDARLIEPTDATSGTYPFHHVACCCQLMWP